MHFSTLLPIVRVDILEVVLALLLYEGSTIHNEGDQFVSCVYFFLCRLRFSSIPTDKNLIASDLYAPTPNSCIFTPIENWTNVYVKLFTRNIPYYHLLKYLLFLLKHAVYTYIKTLLTHPSLIYSMNKWEIQIIYKLMSINVLTGEGFVSHDIFR